MLRATLQFALVLLALVSCDSATNVSVDDLRVELTLDRNQITPGEAIGATLTVFNDTEEQTVVASRCAALARVWVERDEKVIPLPGTSSGCFARITTVQMAAGERIDLEWNVTTSTHANGLEPLTPGTYVIRARLDVFEVNSRDVEFPDLEAPFTVVE